MKEEIEPKVILFGEEVSDNSRERETHGVLWGVFLIFAGTLFLLNSMGVVSWEVWSVLWQLWPLIFILIGVRVLLGGGVLSRWLMFLVSVMVFGSILIYLLSEEASYLVTWLPPQIFQLTSWWREVFNGTI